jgi:CHAD domain-containing protein
MDKERKGLKLFAVCAIIAGLICVASATIYAIFESINRFSEPGQIATSLGLAGMGIVGIMLGLNMLFPRELGSSFIMLLGSFLSASGILGFILLYPDSWFYPKVGYVMLAYAAGIFLLACNILLWQLKSFSVPMNYRPQIEKVESRNTMFSGEGQLTAALGGMMVSQVLHPASEFQSWNSTCPEQDVYEQNADLFLSQTGKNNIEIAGSLEEMRPEALEDKPQESCEATVDLATATTDTDSITDANTAEDYADEKIPAAEETLSIPVVAGTGVEVKKKGIESFLSMKRTDIRRDDHMREAAHKILRFHFGRMLKHERGTMIGKDIEELHDMRVAAMRMRSVLQVFNGHLDMDAMKPFFMNLKATRRSLGTVRDLDVFMEKIQHYVESLPQERQSELDELVGTLLIERDKARGLMLLHLDSGKYNKFKIKFTKVLEKKRGWEDSRMGKDGRPLAHRVRDALPLLLYSQLATVRTYDDLVHADEPSYEMLHALRIDIKILRYTLEFFEEVLGEDTASLVNALKGFQANRGNIHDGVVAVVVVDVYLKYG